MQAPVLKRSSSDPNVQHSAMFGAGKPTPSLFGAAPSQGAAAPASGGLFGQGNASQNQPAGAQSGSAFGQQPSSGLFGQKPSTSLFGQPQSGQPQSGGPFGQAPSSQPQSGGLFGQAQSSQPQSGGLFSQAPSNNQQSGGLFGQSSQPQSGGLFGQSQPNSQPQSGGLFGQSQSNSQPQSGGLFGQSQSNSQPQSGGLFGQSQSNSQPQSGGLFGQSQSNSQPQSGSLFGQSSGQPQSGGLFGQSSGQPQSGGLFGQSSGQPQSGGLFGQSSGQPQSEAPRDGVEAKMWRVMQAWDPQSAEYRFQGYFYNEIPPNQVPPVVTKPPLLQQSVYQRALKQNPDSTKYFPVFALGFEDLEQRIGFQSDMVKAQSAAIDEIAQQLKEFGRQHSLDTTIRVLRAQKKALVLASRFRKLLSRVVDFVPLNDAPHVEALRTRYADLLVQVNNIESAVHELWASYTALLDGDVSDKTQWVVSDPEAVRRVADLLAEQQNGLDLVAKQLVHDKADVQIAEGILSRT